MTLLGRHPEGLGETTFSLEQVGQRWSDDDVTLLRTFSEREAKPAASIGLLIRTWVVPGRRSVYRGTYAITVLESGAKPERRTIAGPVVCGA